MANTGVEEQESSGSMESGLAAPALQAFWGFVSAVTEGSGLSCFQNTAFP